MRFFGLLGCLGAGALWFSPLAADSPPDSVWDLPALEVLSNEPWAQDLLALDAVQGAVPFSDAQRDLIRRWMERWPSSSLRPRLRPWEVAWQAADLPLPDLAVRWKADGVRDKEFSAAIRLLEIAGHAALTNAVRAAARLPALIPEACRQSADRIGIPPLRLADEASRDWNAEEALIAARGLAKGGFPGPALTVLAPHVATVREARWESGAAALKLSNVSAALRWLEDAPMSNAGKDGLRAVLLRAEALERVGKIDAARTCLQPFLSNDFRDEGPVRAFFKLSGRVSAVEWTNALRIYGSLFPQSATVLFWTRYEAIEKLRAGDRPAAAAAFRAAFRFRRDEIPVAEAICRGELPAAWFASNRSLYFDLMALSSTEVAAAPPPDEVARFLEADAAADRPGKPWFLPEARRQKNDPWPASASTPEVPGPLLRRIKTLLALREIDAAETEIKRLALPRAAEDSLRAVLGGWRAKGEGPLRRALRLADEKPSAAVSWGDEARRKGWPTPRLELVRYAADEAGLRPALLFALIREESRFDPDARSWAGATGLCQLMDFTAADLHRRSPLARRVPLRPLDPVQNTWMGAQYLGGLLQRYRGDELRAVAAYNAGPGAVDRWDRAFRGRTPDPFAFSLAVPFDETEHYVRKVLVSAWIYEAAHPDLRSPAWNRFRRSIGAAGE